MASLDKSKAFDEIYDVRSFKKKFITSYLKIHYGIPLYMKRNAIVEDKFTPPMAMCTSLKLRKADKNSKLVHDMCPVESMYICACHIPIPHLQGSYFECDSQLNTYYST